MGKYNYYSRSIYEHQLAMLVYEAKHEFDRIQFSKMSNRELLLNINAYLMYFNCQILTPIERRNIELKMNN